MKKFLTLLISLSLIIFSFSACSNQTTQPKTEEKNNQVTDQPNVDKSNNDSKDESKDEVLDQVAIEPKQEIPKDAQGISLETKQFLGKGNDLIQKDLIMPLLTIKNIDLKKEMMSRCISGVHYSMQEDATPDDPFYKGQIDLYQGCGDSQILAKIRVNKAEDMVEVLDPDTNEYIPAAKWLKIYEEKEAASASASTPTPSTSSVEKSP